MKLLALVVCLALYAGSDAHMYEACPAGWMNFRTSCYRYFGQQLNQVTAENVCRMFSGCGGGIGHLVAINDQAENDFIYNHLKSTAGANPPPQTWLGGRRVNRVGSSGDRIWQWGDGTVISPTTYMAWVENQMPQEQGRNCMVYSELHQVPRWQHINCNRPPLPYVCEMKAHVPTDPATCSGNNPAGGAGAQPAPGPLKQDPLPTRYTKAGNVEERHTGRA